MVVLTNVIFFFFAVIKCVNIGRSILLREPIFSELPMHDIAKSRMGKRPDQNTRQSSGL